GDSVRAVVLRCGAESQVLAFVTRLFICFAGAFFNLMSTCAAKLLPQVRKCSTVSVSPSQCCSLLRLNSAHTLRCWRGRNVTFYEIVHALAAAQTVLLGVQTLLTFVTCQQQRAARNSPATRSRVLPL